MAYVHVEKIMLERPKAMFLYVMINIKKSLKKSEPAAHLEQKNDHYFTRRILCNAPSNAKTCQNIEAFFIAIMRPSLNKQIYCDTIILLRNWVS